MKGITVFFMDVVAISARKVIPSYDIKMTCFIPINVEYKGMQLGMQRCINIELF